MTSLKLLIDTQSVFLDISPELNMHMHVLVYSKFPCTETSVPPFVGPYAGTTFVNIAS